VARRKVAQPIKAEPSSLGPAQAEEREMTVWIYIDTSKDVGDAEYLKVFASKDAAETWLQENDPEGVAFDYEVLD
jgi:hypothetical protein